MMKDCPHRQQKGTKDFKKNAKVKGTAEDMSKDSPTKETQQQKSEASGTTSSSSLLSSPTVSGGGSGRIGGGRSWGVTKSQSRAMKAVRLKQICVETGFQGFALLEWHTLMNGVKMIPIEVELAQGTTVLYRHPKHRTLLSLEEVEPIIPFRLLVERGCKVEWRKTGCSIRRPTLGAIDCWLRNGCLTMHRQPALDMLSQIELEDQGRWRSLMRTGGALNFLNYHIQFFNTWLVRAKTQKLCPGTDEFEARRWL